MDDVSDRYEGLAVFLIQRIECLRASTSQPYVVDELKKIKAMIDQVGCVKMDLHNRINDRLDALEKLVFWKG